MSGVVHWTVAGPDGAPTVFLLPSLGSDISVWRPQVDGLVDAHRVVRIDPRGHGASASPPGPYTVDDLGRDVVDVADALHLDTFHLCGVSLGGLTALWVAVHHGDRLQSLVAANTAARVGTVDGWRARIDAVGERGLAGIRDEVLDRFFAPGFADRDPAAFAEARRAFTAADPDGYAACCAALAGADLRDEVGAITVPTLIIGGELDVATPPGDARWLHGAIRGSRLEVLDRAGHLSNLERPARFTTLLREHIDRTRVATGGG